MDFTITWGGDPEDVCLTAHGVATLRDLDAMFAEAVSDLRWVEGMNVLLDYSGLDMAALSTDEMATRADQLMGMVDAIGRQRFAVVTTDRGSRSTMRMIGLLLDEKVGFQASIFASVREAREWLRNPSTVELPHIMPEP